MLRRPPEILITTPESLNLLLSSHGGRSMLDGLATVILDEIHAVAGSKRGTHLVTAVERLVDLSGEFQRIALSATVRPLAAVADLVAGFEADPSGSAHRKRHVEVIDCPSAKRMEISVRFPPGGTGRARRPRAPPPRRRAPPRRAPTTSCGEAWPASAGHHRDATAPRCSS